MKTLSNVIGLQLHWIQPSMLDRCFELYAGNSLLGELRIEPDWTANGTFSIPSFATERWTIKAKGVLKTRITIRDAGTNDVLAVYLPKFWGGGRVEFVKGTRFLWKSNSFWGTGRGFYNESNEPLLVLKRKQLDLFKIQSAVRIEAQYHELEEMPLLLMLACYLNVQNSYANK